MIDTSNSIVSLEIKPMSPDVLQTFFRLCRLDMIGLSNYSTLIVSVILAVVVYFAYCQFGVYLASLPITLDCCEQCLGCEECLGGGTG